MHTGIRRRLLVRHQFPEKKNKKSQLSNDLLTMKRVVLYQQNIVLKGIGKYVKNPSMIR